MTFLKFFVLVCLFFVLLGVGVGVVWGVTMATGTEGALQTSDKRAHYRVVGATKDSTMEKELNEAARDGCRPIFVVPASAIGEPLVILECG